MGMIRLACRTAGHLLLPGFVAIAVLLVADAPSAQTQVSPPRDFVAWLDAVNTHIPGSRDAAVTRVAPWSRADLNAVLQPLSRETDEARLAIIERALVLHTDVAILYRNNTGGYNLPAGPRTSTTLIDGKAVGQAAGTFQWDFARRLVDRMPRGETRLRIAQRFYRATAAVLQFWGEQGELAEHLSAGLRALGDDAVLMLYEGTRQQAFAGSKIQSYYDDMRRTPNVVRMSTPGTLPPTGPGVDVLRVDATRSFRRAIDADPSLAEARIRLAHVLLDRERPDDAAAELALVSSIPLPPLLDYYASLMNGRVGRTRGQFDEARLAFEHAARLYPDASAPRFGLSELAIARGDRTESLRQLQLTRTNTRVEANEPWWWLDRSHSPSAAELIAGMRAAVTP